MDTTNAPSLKQKGSRLKYSGIFIGNYYCPLNFKDSKNVWLER